MLSTISIIIILILFSVLFIFPSIMNELDKYKDIDITIKEIIFFRKWIKAKKMQYDFKTLKGIRGLVIKLKISIIIFVSALISLLCITILILIQSLDITRNPIVVMNSIIIWNFIIEPVSSIVNKEINKKIKELKYKFFKLRAKSELYIITFSTLSITIVITNLILNWFFTVVFFKEQESVNILLITYLLSIMLYQIKIRVIVTEILKKFIPIEIVNEFNIKAKTYLYLILMYTTYKLFMFNDVPDIFNIILGIPIEAITIFFMIDVYLDKRKMHENKINK